MATSSRTANSGSTDQFISRKSLCSFNLWFSVWIVSCARDHHCLLGERLEFVYPVTKRLNVVFTLEVLKAAVCVIFPQTHSVSPLLYIRESLHELFDTVLISPFSCVWL
ncbi:hypothetical protein BBD46_06455 [Natrialba sp. SSL1]|nr:hypothetical protein BBD46_06455 [Natrialba sp. SSL1]